MNEPILPIPTVQHAESAAGHTSGEGAQTALAEMIRQRKMGENHVEHGLDLHGGATKELPAA